MIGLLEIFKWVKGPGNMTQPSIQKGSHNMKRLLLKSDMRTTNNAIDRITKDIY